jgi:hypothetical protein
MNARGDPPNDPSHGNQCFCIGQKQIGPQKQRRKAKQPCRSRLPIHASPVPPHRFSFFCFDLGYDRFVALKFFYDHVRVFFNDLAVLRTRAPNESVDFDRALFKIVVDRFGYERFVIEHEFKIGFRVLAAFFEFFCKRSCRYYEYRGQDDEN